MFANITQGFGPLPRHAPGVNGEPNGAAGLEANSCIADGEQAGHPETCRDLQGEGVEGPFTFLSHPRSKPAA